MLQHVGDPDRAVSGELAVRSDADLHPVSDGIADALEDLGGVLDLPQRDVPGDRPQRSERVKLASCVAFLKELHGDLARPLRVLPEPSLGHVGVRAELLVVLTAEKVVDRLIHRLSDDIP